MMQTTRIRWLDRLARNGDPGERVRVIYTFSWHDDEQVVPLGGRDPGDGGGAAGGDPVLNPGQATPANDGKPSL
jgi:hypothetical protein